MLTRTGRIRAPCGRAAGERVMRQARLNHMGGADLERQGKGGLRRPARLVPVWVALAATFTAAVALVGTTLLWLGLDPLDVHDVKR
ncbi:hypothetical protein AB0H37_24820 [Actinomadura sp. NPDC023710]|uniref:hypothetical protein n=1 Tax=Actinomadura sp. NPDC023710 TaxID=3158219 RepID=UPI0033D9F451